MTCTARRIIALSGSGAVATPPGRFQRREQLRVADDAVLDHLGQPAAKLGGRQRAQRLRVDDHQLRLLERADQILALRQIDARLAAHAGVHHRQQAGGNLHEGHAAQIAGRGEAGHVAHHAAAQRDHRAAPVQPGRHEVVIQAGHGPQRLVRLALGHLDYHGLETGLAQPVDQRVGMAGSDLRVGDDGCQAGPQAGAPHQVASLRQQALADEDVVAALPVGDRGARVVRIDAPRQADYGFSDFLRRQPAGGDVMRQRVVGRGSLFHQRGDTLRAVGGRQQWPVGGEEQPLGDFVRAGGQADDHTAAAHQLAVARRNQRAAAGRDDHAVFLRQFQAQLGLHGAECRFAILG